jgi:putative peptidoglycan lipid II flippase
MKRSRPSLVRAATSISLATGMSRILGLLRDQVQSYFFGAGPVTDAYLAAFRIPNLLRDLFAEGALSSAFVPTFTAEREQHGNEAAFALADRMASLLSVLLSMLALILFLGAPWILKVYAPGFSAETHDLAVQMTQILSPFLWFVALAALSMSMLNTHGRYFVPALAPASFNVASISGVILLSPLLLSLDAEPGLSLAFGAIVGGLLQFLVQVPALRGIGWRFRPRFNWNDAGVRKIGRLMGPAVFGLAATQVNILVDTMLASRYESAITWLSLSFRLMQLPLGLFGVAIATAHLAHVARDAAHDDLASMRDHLVSAIRMAAVLTIPATAGLIALRTPIVSLLFEHGKFTATDVSQTAAAAFCYVLGLFAYSVTKIQVPTFYALGQTRIPVLASATAVAFKIVTSLLLIRVLPGFGIPAFLGLAFSTSLAAWINFALLSRGLNKRLGSLAGHGLARTLFLLLLLALVMGGVCVVLYDLLASWIPGDGLLLQSLRLFPTVMIGGAIALGGAATMRIPEAQQILRGIVRRKRGTG